MGHIITIEPQIRVRQNVTILDPQDDLREIIDNDMGAEAARLYDDVIRELDEDYEAISDGYRNMLVDVMNELQEIVYAKRLNRNKLERLWQRLNTEL